MQLLVQEVGKRIQSLVQDCVHILMKEVGKVKKAIILSLICAVSDFFLGLGLLFPKYYLIFHSEFPKLLPYYSLRVDPLFHNILLTVSQK